jgi:hypothetical protein
MVKEPCEDGAKAFLIINMTEHPIINTVQNSRRWQKKDSTKEGYRNSVVRKRVKE